MCVCGREGERDVDVSEASKQDSFDKGPFVG